MPQWLDDGFCQNLAQTVTVEVILAEGGVAGDTETVELILVKYGRKCQLWPGDFLSFMFLFVIVSFIVGCSNTSEPTFFGD